MAIRNFIGFFELVFFLTLPWGCVAVSGDDPVFPDDQVPAIMSPVDFDRIWDNLEGYKGMTFKLAGRIIDTQSIDEGALILAAWVPYISHFNLEDGPPDTAALHSRHFAFLFPGITGDPFVKGPDYDPLVAWEGNKFVMEGTLIGSRTMVLDALGEEKSMPLIRTQCIHVWETGKSEPSDQPDEQWAGQIARTFCAR